MNLAIDDIEERRLNGYKLFTETIIRHATEDLRKKEKQPKEFALALYWLADNNDHSILSFREACELLGYEPNRMRQALLEEPKIKSVLSEAERDTLLYGFNQTPFDNLRSPPNSHSQSPLAYLQKQKYLSPLATQT